MSAYWNSPLLLAHKAYVTSMWHDQIYVDHCTMEGLSMASNIQGSPADALVAIFKAKSIDEVLKWVYNFVFFCIPISQPDSFPSPPPFQYSYNLSTILSITNPLGVPWNPVDVKGQDFGSSVPYIAFIWSLDKQSVSLLCKKPQIPSQNHHFPVHCPQKGDSEGLFISSQHPPAHHLCLPRWPPISRTILHLYVKILQ